MVSIMIVIGAILVSSPLGIFVVKGLFWGIDRADGPDRSHQLSDEDALGMHHGVWIGVLERIAVTGAVLASQPTLVMAVVAIKVFGNWGEAKEEKRPDAVERFIIGTLASMIWAAFCGLLGRLILGNLGG